MKVIITALAILAATGAQATEDEHIFKDSDWVIEISTSLTIRSDGGGNIHDYADYIDAIGDTSVFILGTCKSSCTMFLGLSTVCVSPDASFGFHGPSSKNQSISHLTALVDKIASYQSPVIAEQFRSDWGLNRDYTWLTGQELLDLDPSLHSCTN